jgi:hypothetical protein
LMHMFLRAVQVPPFAAPTTSAARTCWKWCCRCGWTMRWRKCAGPIR